MVGKKSNKIAYAFVAVILLFMLSQDACVQAEWHRLRVHRGMSVDQVLEVCDGWVWGEAYSERPAPQTSHRVSLGPRQAATYVDGTRQAHRFETREDLAQFLATEMNDGHPWRLSVTYMGGMRASFAVGFDGQGKVNTLTGVAGPL